MALITNWARDSQTSCQFQINCGRINSLAEYQAVNLKFTSFPLKAVPPPVMPVAVEGTTFSHSPEHNLGFTFDAFSLANPIPLDDRGCCLNLYYYQHHSPSSLSPLDYDNGFPTVISHVVLVKQSARLYPVIM